MPQRDDFSRVNPLPATWMPLSKLKVIPDDFKHFPDEFNMGSIPIPQAFNRNGLKTLQIGNIMDAPASFFSGHFDQNVSQPEKLRWTSHSNCGQITWTAPIADYFVRAMTFQKFIVNGPFSLRWATLTCPSNAITMSEFVRWFVCFVWPQLPRWILILGCLGMFAYQMGTVETRTHHADYQHSLQFQVVKSDPRW